MKQKTPSLPKSSQMKNELQNRLKETVKNRIRGMETDSLRVRNQALEETIDLLLDAHDGILYALDKELSEVIHRIAVMETQLNEISKMAREVFAAKSWLQARLIEWVKLSNQSELKPGKRTKRESSLRPVSRDRKIRLFVSLKEQEDQLGELKRYRDARIVMPRLAYYIYGPKRTWNGWAEFRSEYENWLEGLL